MSVDALRTRAFWREAGKDLRFGAAKWWRSHNEVLADFTRAELLAIGNSLKNGSKHHAIVLMSARIVESMTRGEWDAYVDGTTAALRGLAARRYAAIQAVEQLGFFAVRAVGKAILAAVLA